MKNEKRKKGFTLIELLAVIVILAVIMVIAVPQILNVIKSSKESAASSSIKLVKDAIRTQVSTSGISGVSFDKGEDGCYEFIFGEEANENASKLSLKNKDQIGGSVKYCNGKFEEDTLTFDGTSVSGGNNNQVSKVCKRVTRQEELHTEICTQTDSSEYCSGAGYTESGSKGTKTIVYGNIGTSGTLTSGDAFDCDVTGTGNYERFYYVTDLEGNSNAAVLIYYNNVSRGEANSSSTYAYVSKDDYISAGGTESDYYESYGNSNKGPLTAIKQLPSTSKWSKVSLKNTTRNLKNEVGTEKINSFSYEGYAARLLTVQEVNKACGIKIGSFTVGELDTCNYLMENTKYSSDGMGSNGYWLENPVSSDSIGAWSVYGPGRHGGGTRVAYPSSYGVRPAIEVLKSDIEY